MKQTRKDKINEVLTQFLGREAELNRTYEDGFISLVLDEDEIEILSTAIEESLEKGNENESQN